MTNRRRTRRAGVRVVGVLAVAALALGVSPLAGMASGQDQSVGAYDAYFKITVDQYQCGTIEDPETGATQFAIYGTGGAEWSWPDNTTVSVLLETLSPYASVIGDQTFSDATGESGSQVGVDATFPIVPPGYPAPAQPVVGVSRQTG